MGIHDWTRVDDGAFHSFHNAWITHISEALNGGILPKGYYALAEQHSLHYVADVLTLQSTSKERDSGRGGISVADAPPRVSARLTVQPSYVMLRRTLTVRRVTGHRIVALIEILSPGNKDSRHRMQQFVDKATDAIRNGCNLLILDLFPPGKTNPKGIHAKLLDYWLDATYDPPAGQPLTLVSYESRRIEPVEVYLESLAVGQTMPDMPLFLREGYYVNVPLQAAYDEAFRGTADYYRELLEKPPNGKRKGRAK